MYISNSSIAAAVRTGFMKLMANMSNDIDVRIHSGYMYNLLKVVEMTEKYISIFKQCMGITINANICIQILLKNLEACLHIGTSVNFPFPCSV